MIKNKIYLKLFSREYFSRLALLLLGACFTFNAGQAETASARSGEAASIGMAAIGMGATRVAGNNNFLPLMLLQFTPGWGSLEGLILDASTDTPVPGVELCTGATCVQSDSEGYYRFESLWAGSMAITAGREDYFTARQGTTIRPDQTSYMDFALVHSLEGENTMLRIVVTWNETKTWFPSGMGNDLDSHLWVDNRTQGVSHIYADPNPNTDPDTDGDCTMFPNACQVNDDYDGYGPETTDFRILEPNTTYSFGILNFNQGYQGVPPMVRTGAKVQIFSQVGKEAEFSVPLSGVGDFWYIFSMDTSGIIIPAKGSQGCIIWYPGESLPQCP
jgi:hypothetical protein